MKAICTGFIEILGPENNPAVLVVKDHDRLLFNIVLFEKPADCPMLNVGREYEISISGKSIKIKASAA